MGYSVGVHKRFSACGCMHTSFLRYKARWALISDICGSTCHCICGNTLTIPPFHTLLYYPRTRHHPCPLSQLKTHWGGTPPLENACAVAKPTIGARQRRLCLSSCSPLPAPCVTKTSQPASHPHNTLPCNHTSLPHVPRPHRSTS